MATILTIAEVRVALGLTTTITDLHRAILEMFLPMVDAAIIQELHYNPVYGSHVEWYPLADRGIRSSAGGGIWHSNRVRAHLESPLRGEVLQLRHLPVRAISEIKVDTNGGFGQKANTFGTGTAWTAGTDYYQELLEAGHNATGHVYAVSGWPSEPGSIKVTYSAGYTEHELRGRATVGPTDDDVAINASGIYKAALLTAVKHFKTAQAHTKQSLAGIIPGVLSSESLGSYSYSQLTTVLQAMVGMQVNLPGEARHDLAPFINYGAPLAG